MRRSNKGDNVYEVRAATFVGDAIDLKAAVFPSLDMARGFAIGVARWMQAVSPQEGQIEISSDGDPIESATFAYWAQQEFREEI